jgi:hypothetical protein
LLGLPDDASMRAMASSVVKKEIYMRNTTRFFTVVLILASMVSVIGCSSASEEGTSNNTRAVRMMQILPETVGDSDYVDFYYIDYFKIRTDKQLALEKDYWIDEEGIHFIPWGLDDECEGVGFAMDNDIYLYEMNISVDSLIEHDSTGTYDYGGFSVWTGEYNRSTVLIEGIYISGDDEYARACIDVVNGEATSMYKKTRGIVDRMPDSYMLSLGFSLNYGTFFNQYGLITYGESSAIQGNNHVQTDIYEFNSSESAQRYSAEMPIIFKEYESPDVTRDGSFVTVATTSTGW